MTVFIVSMWYIFISDYKHAFSQGLNLVISWVTVVKDMTCITPTGYHSSSSPVIVYTRKYTNITVKHSMW